MDQVTTNEWQWWLDALAGKVAPIHDGEPQQGFYRVRRKGRDGFSPVAYWKDTNTGEQRCHMDGQDFVLQRAMEIWPYASKSPVTREDYSERLRTGKWPGESAAVVGHNAAPPDDSIEAIKDRIENFARQAEEMIAAGAATTQDIADQASDVANTLGELENKADTLRALEKQPHVAAAAVVDAKWVPMRDRAADLKKRIKLIVLTPFQVKQSEEDEKANVAAISSGIEPAALPQRRLTSGFSKRQTALRTQTSAEVTDWSALLAALHEHPDIRDAAQRIANASAKVGVALPGTTIKQTKVAA